MSGVLERFEDGFIPEPNTGCWLWIKSVDKDGYGYFGLEGKLQRSHRVSWELYKDEPIGDLWVLHRCDTPSCVNPDHLFLGTHKDNMHDMVRKGRGWTQKLAESDLNKIRMLLERGVQQKVIGRMYGVSAEAISHIATGRTWGPR